MGIINERHAFSLAVIHSVSVSLFIVFVKPQVKRIPPVLLETAIGAEWMQTTVAVSCLNEATRWRVALAAWGLGGLCGVLLVYNGTGQEFMFIR